MSLSRQSTTEAPPLSFKRGRETSQPFRPPSNRIGWVHTKSDKPGARFDIVIKDPRGHTIVEKRGCGNETDRYGELMNIEVLMGQDITVEVENIQGADEVEVFLN